MYFPTSWRCQRKDKISIQREMQKENQPADSRLPHSDFEAHLVVLGHLIDKSPYRPVLRKYEQQIGRIAMENPQIKEALARIGEGSTKTCALGKSAHKTVKRDLFVLNCFLEFIYFATDEVIRELSGDQAAAV